MNEILITAFVEAIKEGNMQLNQVPIPYQEEVNNRLNPTEEEKSEIIQEYIKNSGVI